MIYVFLATGFEDIEALAPVDIMRRAGLAVETVSITGELVVMSAHGVGIMADKLNCDYYRMLKGDMDAVNAYHGEYMVQYSWAELTAAQLEFGNW